MCCERRPFRGRKAAFYKLKGGFLESKRPRIGKHVVVACCPAKLPATPYQPYPAYQSYGLMGEIGQMRPIRLINIKLTTNVALSGAFLLFNLQNVMYVLKKR
jgi:hypothetical protein